MPSEHDYHFIQLTAKTAFYTCHAMYEDVYNHAVISQRAGKIDPDVDLENMILTSQANHLLNADPEGVA